MSDLKTTALNALHRELNAKLVPFAGYEMPVQYQGVLAEHKHCRSHAGLFDVSHMGQCVLSGPNVIAELETLVTADLNALALNQMVYSLFTNDNGGIDDDLMITRWAEDSFFLVVNAACKEDDFAKLATLPSSTLKVLDSQALIALQGPSARAALIEIAPEVAELTFLNGMFTYILDQRCYVSCSGYTGEDGFEISCSNDAAEAIAKALLAIENVAPIGLGARDSLRLEVGLCLYGHDLNTDTNPIEAGLIWAIAKSRRNNASFKGSAIITQQIANGPIRKRVGLDIDGRAPVREGAHIVDASGKHVGAVCSGTFSPTLAKPIAMAYINSDAINTELFAEVRGKKIPVNTRKMPFVPQNYYRG